MAKLATRPLRSLVAVVFATVCAIVVMKFATLGSSFIPAAGPARGTTQSVAPARVSRRRTTAPGSTEMEALVSEISDVETAMHRASEPTSEELVVYDQTLTANIQMLENLVADSFLRVKSLAQLKSLEKMSKKVWRFKELLTKVRAAQARQSQTTEDMRAYLERVVLN